MSSCYTQHLSLHSVLLSYLLMIICHSQGDYYKNASKDTDNWLSDTNGVIMIDIWTESPSWQDKDVSGGEFTIAAAGDDRYWAFSIKASKEKWGFNAGVPSFLRLTMHGTSTVNSANEAGLLLMFSDEDGSGFASTYFTSLIQVDGT
eukprot:872200_1